MKARLKFSELRLQVTLTRLKLLPFPLSSLNSRSPTVSSSHFQFPACFYFSLSPFPTTFTGQSPPFLPCPKHPGDYKGLKGSLVEILIPGGHSALWLRCALSQQTMVDCVTRAGPDCDLNSRDGSINMIMMKVSHQQD